MFIFTRQCRRRRMPSQRNLKIFEAVRIDGQKQIVVAEQHGLQQSRISQIVASVEAWLAWREALEASNAGASYQQ